NTAMVGPGGGNIGIGFAIPSSMAQAVMEHLTEYGKVRRGQLGLVAQDLTPELAHAFGMQQRRGAVVAQVAPGSAAETAGLQPGDVIVALNERPVGGSGDLRNIVGLLHVGTRVRLDVLRKGRPLTLHVEIADPLETATAAGESSRHLAGAILGNIQDNHVLAGQVQGVQVLEVEHGSPAWSSGLRTDDIIVSINQQALQSVDDVAVAVKRNPDALLMNIRRGNGALFIVIR
ncbi:MAG: PDZ domain-containing protein, partial [Gammaproteobacteria bacterium]|nr:PDZ domain-containing protein [Gammaproteobacteria bacterium]